MPYAYGYIRVSDDKQVQSGLGLEAQHDFVLRYFQVIQLRYPGLQWGGMYVDEGVSARKRRLVQRKAGAKLNAILRPGDHVIFARLDRSFRWLPDFVNTMHMWEQRSINAHFGDLMLDLKTANGKLIANIMAVISQWWSDYLSERTREAMAAAKERGQVHGQNRGRPIMAQIVKHDGKKYLVRDREQEVIQRYILYLRDHLQLPWRKISDQLERVLCVREGRKYQSIAWGQRPWLPKRCRLTYYAHPDKVLPPVIPRKKRPEPTSDAG